MTGFVGLDAQFLIANEESYFILGEFRYKGLCIKKSNVLMLCNFLKCKWYEKFCKCIHKIPKNDHKDMKIILCKYKNSKSFVNAKVRFCSVQCPAYFLQKANWGNFFFHKAPITVWYDPLENQFCNLVNS